MSADAVRIALEPASDDLRAAYLRFGLDRAASGAAGLDWSFGDAPFAVARLGGRVVGLSAYQPRRIALGAAEGRAFQAVDSYVDAAARGQGVFRRLADAFQAGAAGLGADVVWGLPNENAAPHWFGRGGWTDLGALPFVVRPLRASMLRRRLLGGPPPPDHPAPGAPPDAAVLGDWLDAAWDRFRGGARGAAVAIRRDGAALRRRLLDGPDPASYRAWADPGDDGALVVTRTLARHGARICYVMEALGGRRLHGPLRAALAAARADGAEVALAWCPVHAPNRPTLRRAGFVTLPERLRPTRIRLGARAASDRGRIAEGAGAWYLSYLDSDVL